jgi:hypothetical protein
LVVLQTNNAPQKREQALIGIEIGEQLIVNATSRLLGLEWGYPISQKQAPKSTLKVIFFVIIDIIKHTHLSRWQQS